MEEEVYYAKNIGNPLVTPDGKVPVRNEKQFI